MGERRMTTIRLFGVNITVEDQNDHHSPVSQTDDNHDMSAIDETARKRKLTTRSPNQEGQESSLPKKPKILRLFGVDIPIDHLLTSSSPKNPQNPNQEEEAPAAPIPPQSDPVLLFEKELTQNPNQEEEASAAPIPPQSDPVLLFEKELTFSDVAESQNRLLITRSHSLMATLTEEERGRVEFDFLRVVTKDKIGVEYTLRLKRWTDSGGIIINQEWKKLVRANRLQRGDSVEGWGYRVDGQFRLLLNIFRNQS